MLTAGVILFAVVILYSFISFNANLVSEIEEPKNLNAMYKEFLFYYTGRILKSDKPFICLGISEFTNHVGGHNHQLMLDLEEHFKANKPTAMLHSEFYNNSLFRKNNLELVWWTLTDEGRAERIKFLDKMIKITA